MNAATPAQPEGLFADDAGCPRCTWCQATPVYRHYHDTEWGFPVADDRRLFEKLCLEGFQSGLSWLTILNKREGFRAAFDQFDAEKVAAYGEVVDKALLIVDPKHLASAMTMVPDWWGIMVAERGTTQGVRFRRIRPERANKGIDPLVLARLLWRPEAQAILRGLGVSERDLRAPRATLYKMLADRLPLRRLSQTVRQTLKARTSWRDRPPLL